MYQYEYMNSFENVSGDKLLSPRLSRLVMLTMPKIELEWQVSKQWYVFIC